MSDRPRAVVVGASSGVGRSLADELAARGYDLVVSARDHEDVAAVAADLELRHGVTVTPIVRRPQRPRRRARAVREALPRHPAHR